MGDNENIVGERLAETVFKMADVYKYANMSLHKDINSVLIMVITGLERPVLQTSGNGKRVFLTMVMLKR